MSVSNCGEFNNVGFEAVASFFGDDNTNTATTNSEQQDENHTSSTNHRNRNNHQFSGLGTSSSTLKKSHMSNESSLGHAERMKLRKQIMSIGKRKNRSNHEGEIDDDDENPASSMGDVDDEDGRTSIKVKEKKGTRTIMDDVQQMLNKAKKKKKKTKKGKKERMAEKVSEDATVTTTTTSETEVKDKNNDEESTVKAVLEGQKEETTDQITSPKINDVVESNEPPRKKRKKPKVRSKQKNIRKDSRTSNQKPEHLRIGTKDYAGRPLTPQTRAILSIPQSRSQRIRSFKASLKMEESVTLGYESFDTGGLAVDDLLGDNSDNAENIENIENTENTENIENTKITDEKMDTTRNSENTENIMIGIDVADSGEPLNATGNEDQVEKEKMKSKKKRKKKSKYKNLR